MRDSPSVLVESSRTLNTAHLAARFAAQRQEGHVRDGGEKKLSKIYSAHAIDCKACSSGANCECSKTHVSLKERRVQKVCAMLKEREAPRARFSKILHKAGMAYAQKNSR